MTSGPHSSNPRARNTLTVAIIALAAASIFYRLLMWQRLEHTSLVFIGIPALLAIMVVRTEPPVTATGLIMKVIAMALLISSIAFGEAFVCILFAAPLFFLVGVVFGTLLDRLARPPQPVKGRTLFVLLLILTPASLEGVIPGLEFERTESVTVVRTVHGSEDEVMRALAAAPRFAAGLPPFLRLGFPTPGATHGAGLTPGDTRAIEFLHGHHPGTLVLVVSESRPGMVEFRIASDDSYITHWLAWERSTVQWREVSPGRTEVSWTLQYRRRLDPAWYFAPLERYGVGQAAGYLIDTLATPMRETR